MKQIPLTKGKFAIVDDEDYDFLMQWKWYHGSRDYAARCGRSNGKNKTILMHRVINNTPDHLHTDHINGNCLDNRKSNLRSATRSQNMCNAGPRSKTWPRAYKGVYYLKSLGIWRAQIRFNNKKKHLGDFKEVDKAVLAYNSAAIKYHGEFAKLNPVQNGAA